MANSGIYKITSPSKSIYIGQAIDLDNRIRRYKRLNCKSQRRLYSSLVKYGFENHNIEILAKGDFSRNLLNELEVHFIRVYNTFNSDKGMNLKNGGYNNLSEETREKIRKTKTGKKLNLTDERRDNISKQSARVHKGKIISDYSRKKMSEAKQGKPRSIDSRKSVSVGMIGRERTLETCMKVSEKLKGNSYPKCEVLNIETGIFYDTITEAAKSQSQYSLSTLFSKIRGDYFNNTQFRKCSQYV